MLKRGSRTLFLSGSSKSPRHISSSYYSNNNKTINIPSLTLHQTLHTTNYHSTIGFRYYSNNAPPSSTISSATSSSSSPITPTPTLGANATTTATPTVIPAHTLTSEQLRLRKVILMKKLLERLVDLNREKSNLSSTTSSSTTTANLQSRDPTTVTPSSILASVDHHLFDDHRHHQKLQQVSRSTSVSSSSSSSSLEFSQQQESSSSSILTSSSSTTATTPSTQSSPAAFSASSSSSSSSFVSPSAPLPNVTYGLPKKLQKILKKSEQEEYTEEIGEKAVIRSIIGNTLITSLKFLAYATSGSAAMLSEAFHSLIDSINQGLLYVGLKQAKQQPDSLYQYGYGRAPYFWSLVSAMGIFWMGFGLVGYHGVSQLLNPPEVMEFGYLTPLVLATSFLIDGSVLWGVLQDLKKNKPKGMSLYHYLKGQKDPMILTVLLEDIAACTGVLFAGFGIAASYVTQNAIYDSIACIGVAGLLGVVSVLLVQTNKRFLIGRAVEPEIENHIREILASRPAIEAIYAVQSQYISPTKFSYKAEIDFNGAYFAEQLIKLGYDIEFQNVPKEDLRNLLACFSEDVMRLVEKEIDDIEDEIRQYYPEAGYIELEPNANPRDRNSFLINQRRKMKELQSLSEQSNSNNNSL